MGKFNKTGKKEMPALNTSSLPDLFHAFDTRPPIQTEETR